MIDLPTDVFYLRRPMSVLTTHTDGSFDIYYKIHGVGTAMLANVTIGDALTVLGPLGNTFSLPTQTQTALLIGGGIGIAPLYCFGQQLKDQTGHAGHCVYGARSNQELGLQTELTNIFGEQLALTTDDGSVGFYGHVGQWLKENPHLVSQAKEAYLCGPTPMMAAVSYLLETLNPTILIEVSLEEMMPCGTGACSGCVIFRTDQTLPSKTCVEGPIFNSKQVVWPHHNASASSSIPTEVACLRP